MSFDDSKTMRDLTRALVSVVQDVFGAAAGTIVVDSTHEEPVQSLSLGFVAYGYSEVRFGYDRGRSGFSIAVGERASGISVRGSRSGMPSSAELRDMAVRIDELVRLRIPDKYLAAEPWAAS